MTRWRAGALLSALLLAAVVPGAAAQDSAAVRAPLSIDPADLASIYRIYDIVVHREDSAVVIGQRTVAMMPGDYAGTPGWRLIETRTGAVPAADSLWLDLNARPLYWSSALGAGRLTGQFVDDSLFGMVAIGRTSRNIVLPVPGNVLATSAMMDVVLSLSRVHEAWTDSATMLVVDPSNARVLAAELLVVALDSVRQRSDPPRPVWVVAVRTAHRQMLYWIDQETGFPLKIQERLPGHVGALVEYRLLPMPTIRLPLFWPWQ